MNTEFIPPKLLKLVCAFVLVGILVAGLWPFHSPRNQVTWLSDGNGVHFGRFGTLLSAKKFHSDASKVNGACSVEIWLQPVAVSADRTLLAFYAPANHRQFSMHLVQTGFALRSDVVGLPYAPWSYVRDVFARPELRFITITANQERTAVYVDGMPAAIIPQSDFPLAASDFAGELVVANSPAGADNWSGVLRGLAFYDQELAPDEVAQHYESWTKKGRPDLSGNDHAVAIYPFDEHSGRIVHNHANAGPDLYIPEKFEVIDKPFLEPFWREFRPTWGYAKDDLVNVAGFIPLGFVFAEYFRQFKGTKRPWLLTVLFGFMVSLTIEVLQGFLPTRSSGTTDLITNTLGTACGVYLNCMTLSWRRNRGIQQRNHRNQ